jgi:hypothetical protein
VASGSAHREVSLRSYSVAGGASKRYFERHLARHAPTALIPTNRITQNELAPLNRSAPLPAFALSRRAPNGRRRPTSPRPRQLHMERCTDVPGAAACASTTSWRSRKLGGARFPRRVPPNAFVLSRSSSGASCRLTHGHRVSCYSPCERQGTESEPDFRCAAPAAATRLVACAATLCRSRTACP